MLRPWSEPTEEADLKREYPYVDLYVRVTRQMIGLDAPDPAPCSTTGLHLRPIQHHAVRPQHDDKFGVAKGTKQDDVQAKTMRTIEMYLGHLAIIMDEHVCVTTLPRSFAELMETVASLRPNQDRVWSHHEALPRFVIHDELSYLCFTNTQIRFVYIF
ncbi:hypothetical protein SPRG_09969 [Saprolegnia parasitica CBS 223.65]|uniref:Uncharacterized protein n=1 Tax=Saprolegnia parasitica (strain CBS 223.65) TaxID=695850 RepID=A0A067C9F8_SAPPC|nr:hypothetical protein SPRG_09969 [Saprolegnia parasitica CBS 223.65]KDO23161.1 hypothetical protein SPRG_09969 [Saprolegnia parasitica CBS 223.65]|eukprot:XP_012206113.1 hypothetical protein SPRG_09969 [Saprolegnia parasitica CBS 223.65]